VRDNLGPIAGHEEDSELAAQAIFYALFRVVEIEELSNAEDAVEWARSLVEDPVLRRAFGDGVIDSVARRAQDELESRSGEGAPDS